METATRPSPFVARSTGRGRIDWRTERDRIDLAAVATNLLGPAPGRRGERSSRKLWWCCPFHDDRNPSFCVDPGSGWWRCFGCSEHGDAAALVMRLKNVSFPEAIAFLTGTGGRGAPRPSKPLARPPMRPPPKPPPVPSGLPEAGPLAVVVDAEQRLWSPEGAGPLAYLRGRGLTDETIRRARLGWTAGVSVPTRDGARSYRASGVAVPWFNRGRLAMLKIRQPDGRSPKYIEVFRAPDRLAYYPGPEAIIPGRPAVIVEGEFDAMVLGQALGDMASVVTLGSASARPDARALGAMLACPVWFVATDNDEAGNRAAVGWPARARRVRPPGSFKDWTEALAGKLDLARWWRDIFAGVERPPLFTWDELASWRWGENDDGCHDLPNIVIDRPRIDPN